MKDHTIERTLVPIAEELEYRFGWDVGELRNRQLNVGGWVVFLEEESLARRNRYGGDFVGSRCLYRFFLENMDLKRSYLFL